MELMYELILIIIILFTVPTAHAAGNLLINEVLPNPKGKDSGQEWLELFNQSNKTIDLKEWKIVIGKKTIKLKEISKAQSYLLIKTPLNNSGQTIQLINPSGNIADDLVYKTAPEGLSYSKIVLKSSEGNKYAWQWTSPTQKEKNQSFFSLNGKILSPLTKDHFELLTEQGKNIKVKITNKKKLPLYKVILKKNKEVKVIVEKIGREISLRNINLKTL